jgi:hypothetical protein
VTDIIKSSLTTPKAASSKPTPESNARDAVTTKTCTTAAANATHTACGTSAVAGLTCKTIPLPRPPGRRCDADLADTTTSDFTYCLPEDTG